MCYGFCTIVIGNSEDFKLYFVEPDSRGNISHSEILGRLYRRGVPLRDLSVMDRNFVRTENQDWSDDSFMFDEYQTVPGWVKDHEAAIRDRVSKLIDRIKPIKADFLRACKMLLEEFHMHHSGTIQWRWGHERADASACDEYRRKRAVLKEEYIAKLSQITGFVAKA